jgi:hypothetical protein
LVVFGHPHTSKSSNVSKAKLKYAAAEELVDLLSIEHKWRYDTGKS